MKFTIYIFETAVYKGGSSGLKDKTFDTLEDAEQFIKTEFSDVLDARIYKHMQNDDPIKRGRLAKVYRLGELVNDPETKEIKTLDKVARLNDLVQIQNGSSKTIFILIGICIVVGAVGAYFFI